MKLSVVIPTYNGGNHLSTLCREITTALKSSFEIIIVDDGSPQRPEHAVKEIQDAGIPVRAVYLRKNYGQQLATLAGMHYASGEYIFTIDDDLSHNPEDFPAMLALAKKENRDAVYGIPDSKGGGSKIRDMIFRIFFSTPPDLYVSSFRLITRSLTDRILQDLSEYRYLSAAVVTWTKNITNLRVPPRILEDSGSRYTFTKKAFLAMSLIRCSPIIPAALRKSGKAAEMIRDLL